MAQSAPAGQINAQIQGGVSGQVAVGSYILQIGAVHGGVVNVAPPGQQAVPAARPVPVLLRPRPFPGLLGRDREVATALAALASAAPVEFSGEPGIGKTALLRFLANDPRIAAYPDGLIYLPVRGEPLMDLLQALWEAFYRCDVPYKPPDVEIRVALQARRALIVLDDLDLARDEVEALMDAAPGCVFLLASAERRLWSGGSPIALHGLPAEAALALIEQELRRPLRDEERPAASALCTALISPLRILQAAALAREDGKSIREVADHLAPGGPSEAPSAPILATLSLTEQQVLAALAALSGASVGTEHIATLAAVSDPAPVLDALERRQLVQTHSPRYSLTGGLADTLATTWDLTAWRDRTLRYFADWAERYRQRPDIVREEARGMLNVLGWGERAGRWGDVLRLGGAIEGTLAINGRWGAWERALGWMLTAARATGNQAAVGWTLHQLGTRALCLGETAVALNALGEALRLRESLGDVDGAAVTRHNLSMIYGPPPAPPDQSPPSTPPRDTPPRPPRSRGVRSLILASKIIGVVLAVAVATGGIAQALPHTTITIRGSNARCPGLSPPPLIEKSLSLLPGIRFSGGGETLAIAVPDVLLSAAAIETGSDGIRVSVQGMTVKTYSAENIDPSVTRIVLGGSGQALFDRRAGVPPETIPGDRLERQGMNVVTLECQ